jgi:hypothetical protein
MRGWLATLSLGILVVPIEAAAGVPDSYGFGSRAAAMAGAVTGDAQDFSATFYNPSGIAEADGISVSIGYMMNVQQLRVSGLDNGVDEVRGLVGGLVAPGEVFGVPFAFSVGVHLPDDGLSYIKARRQGIPRWELYDTRSQLLYLSAGLAVRPWPWLEVGGGIGYLSATTGSFAIRGEADILSPFESKLQHEVDADLTAVRFPQVGMRFLWEGWGAFGVTYRGQSSLDLQLDALLDGVVDFAGIDVPLQYAVEAKTIAAFTPQQIAMGVSFQRLEDFHFNLDVTWVNWSAYLSPTAQIDAVLDAQPPPGTPIELPVQPDPPPLAAPNFQDRWVPRVGVEYLGAAFGPGRQVHDDERALVVVPLRVGYAYERSPVPDQTGPTNLVDANRHSLTMGLGVHIHRPSEPLGASFLLDGHALFSFFPERVTLKDNPADFVGDYRANGNIFGGGATLSVVF